NYLEAPLVNEAAGTVQVKSGELRQDENTTTTNEGKFEVESGATFAATSSGKLTDVSGAGSFDLIDSAVLSGTVPKEQTVTADAIESHSALVKISGTV